MQITTNAAKIIRQLGDEPCDLTSLLGYFLHDLGQAVFFDNLETLLRNGLVEIEDGVVYLTRNGQATLENLR